MLTEPTSNTENIHQLGFLTWNSVTTKKLTKVSLRWLMVLQTRKPLEHIIHPTNLEDPFNLINENQNRAC